MQFILNMLALPDDCRPLNEEDMNADVNFLEFSIYGTEMF